ncbi:MAG: hypothetical protein ABL866_04180 [Devosia sp.]
MGAHFHENDTPHGAAYLARPWQLNPPDVFYRKVVSENTPAAERALLDYGLIAEGVRATAGGPYPHRFMASCITASIELAVKRDPKLRYISRREIMGRSPNRTLSIPCSVTFNGQHYDRPYTPDGIFGIEYADKAKLFFMIEADRRTEPTTRSSLETSSYLRKTLQLREVIGKGGYKRHFGMTAGMLSLTFTTRQENELIDMVENTIGKNRYMLFTTLEEFAGYLKAPDVMFDLLTRPYHRAGYADFFIDKP